MTTTFSLKQGETRTSSGPIPQPLRSQRSSSESNPLRYFTIGFPNPCINIPSCPLNIMTLPKLLNRLDPDLSYKTAHFLSNIYFCPFHALSKNENMLKLIPLPLMTSIDPAAIPENLRGIVGQSMSWRGQKSKNILKLSEFRHFFLPAGGKLGAEQTLGRSIARGGQGA